jgi:hypothetical protein
VIYHARATGNTRDFASPKVVDDKTVTVTTPSGTLTSNVPFHVIK